MFMRIFIKLAVELEQNYVIMTESTSSGTRFPRNPLYSAAMRSLSGFPPLRLLFDSSESSSEELHQSIEQLCQPLR